MSLIDYLNELIDYSMGFPFYQRLNPLFNGISNKDTPLSIGRSIPPGQGGTSGASLLDIPLNNGFNH